jgi:CPA2 family monovalent cation:H+ antiporter-2
MDVVEFEIPEGSACAGKTLKELAIRPSLGCSILEIDRQGYVLDRIRPDEMLYPGDRLLLFGTPSQIEQTQAFLMLEGIVEKNTKSDFEEAILDTVIIPGDAKIIDTRLADAGIFEATGIQIMGVEREGKRTMNPSGEESVRAGDRLLIMGSAVEIRMFQTWIRP